MIPMGFFDTLFTAKHDTPISTVTFTLDNAAHTYEDGNNRPGCHNADHHALR